MTKFCSKDLTGRGKLRGNRDERALKALNAGCTKSVKGINSEDAGNENVNFPFSKLYEQRELSVDGVKSQDTNAFDLRSFSPQFLSFYSGKIS